VVNGKDMAWNFKNLHRIFPTVNVYREGKVRELGYALMPEIDNYSIDVDNKIISFRNFLDSVIVIWT
jgi:hypothetical protein